MPESFELPEGWTSLELVLPVLLALMVWNLWVFMLFGQDKRRAASRRRRISEKRLLLACVLGGACGGWAGMFVWRHKTKHARFAWGVPVLALVQVACGAVAAASGLLG